jgi:tetratricopeptide (TPR) repeat protein
MTDDYEDYRDIVAQYSNGASILCDEGEFQKGVERCDAGIRFAQEHEILYGRYKERLYGMRLACHYHMHDIDGALSDLTTLIEQIETESDLEDEFPWADLVYERASYYYQRGEQYLRKGDYAQSLVDLTTAITLYPNRANYYFLRARALYFMGRKQKAIEDINRVLDLTDLKDWEIENAFKVLEQIEAGIW